MKTNMTHKMNTVTLVCAFVLFFAAMFYLASAPVYAEGTRIGQATAGEGGSLSGNVAGDQSGNECAVSNYGGKGWVYVFRAKDPATGKALAENMKKACANNHIGYDMKDRMTLYYVAEANGWDLETITTNCETTCVDLVSVCLNAAGVAAPKGWSSKAVYGDLMATGLFDCFTSADYTHSAANLLPGDILCNPNAPHTAMIVESPNSFYFDVTYQDTKGETQSTKVKDGDEIVLNLNNGEAVVPVTVETTTDLESYEPKRDGAKFKGWEKNEGESFSAKYQTQMMAISTGNERREIGE